MASTATLRARLESALPERLSSALLLRERAAPLTVSTGVAALDALTGGLPRGALSEIAGPASSGRTGVMLAALCGSHSSAGGVRTGGCKRQLRSRFGSGGWRGSGAPALGTLQRYPATRIHPSARRAWAPEPGVLDQHGLYLWRSVGTSIEGDGPAVAGWRLWRSRARSRRYSPGQRAPSAADLVVPFSPHCGAYCDRASAGGTGALREDLRVSGGAIGTRSSMRT